MTTRERELITAGEVSRRLHMSHSTVIRATRRSEIPYVQQLPGIRGAYLYDPDVIDRLARERLDAQRDVVRAMEAQT